MKNCVAIFNDFSNIADFVKDASELGYGVFITKDMNTALQFTNDEVVKIIAIDKTYNTDSTDIENLEHFGAKVVFVDKDTSIDFDKIIKEVDISRFKKAGNIFRDIEEFKAEITQEVRRARRYKYFLVVVLFEVDSSEYTERIINYFASKIREFDSIFLYDERRFGMTLPHTGWYGAEVLTKRLIENVTKNLGIGRNSIKNIIITYKDGESDLDFVQRIEDAIEKGEYYSIDRNIDFEVWKDELFVDFKNPRVIRVFNKYKGLIISHDAELVVYGEDTLLLRNTHQLQRALIKYEGATYFESEKLAKIIKGKVKEFSKDGIVLHDFSFSYEDYSKSHMRLVIEDEVHIEAISSGVRGKLLELSLSEMIASFPNKIGDIGDSQDFAIYLKGEDIGVEGVIKNIDGDIVEISYRPLKTDDSITLSTYLSEQQIKFIKEIKNL